MLLRRVASALVVALLFAVMVPHVASATRAEDEAMTKDVLTKAAGYSKAFTDIAKAWKKAAPGSPEADALVQKGADALDTLKMYVEDQLPLFEAREAWYEEQGKDDKDGLAFMNEQFKKLKGYLDDAKKQDMYGQLNP